MDTRHSRIRASSIIPHETTNVVLLWSAGPDSTACLLDLLEEGYTVVPLLSVSPNLERDTFAMSTMVAATHISCLLNIPFSVIPGGRSLLPPNDMNAWEDVLSGRYEKAATYVKDNGILIATARCVDDDYTWANEAAWARCLEIANNFAPAIEWPARSKCEVFERLGQKLWNLTWSCTDSTNVSYPCGECTKCLTRKQAVIDSVAERG